MFTSLGLYFLFKPEKVNIGRLLRSTELVKRLLCPRQFEYSAKKKTKKGEKDAKLFCVIICLLILACPRDISGRQKPVRPAPSQTIEICGCAKESLGTYATQLVGEATRRVD